MSRSRRLTRLWHAVSAVFGAHRPPESEPAQRARRRAKPCSIERLEERQMLTTWVPAEIGAALIPGSLDEGQCATIYVCSTMSACQCYGSSPDSISSWTITWGDGSTEDISGASGSLNHLYDDNGSYSVYAAPHGNCTYNDVCCSVAVNNVAPCASLNLSSYTVNEGDTVTAYFTNESDPSNADRSAGFHYSFSLDSGNLAGAYADANQGSQFTFPDNGYYTVYGRIFDKDNGYSDYSTCVTVNNVAPTASISVSSTCVDEGQCVTVSLSDATDASSVDQQAGFYYSFGLDSGSLGSYSSSSQASFYFDDNGTFTIYARIVDKDGGYTQYSVDGVTVNNVAPTGCLTVSNSSFNEGDSVSVCFSGQSDPSCADTSAGFHYSFTLDEQGLAGSYAGAGTDSAANLLFDDNGSYTVFGRIFDKDGGYTQYTVGALTVNNVAPTGYFSLSTTSVEGTDPVTASFSGQYDPSSADTSAGFHYSFAVDDDEPADTYASAPDGASRQFSFTDNGTYLLAGRIFDKDDGYNTYSACVTVSGFVTAPSALAAILGNARNRIHLTWTDTSDCETGFRIERKLANTADTAYEAVETTGANVTTCNDDLPSDYAGKIYTYRVFAYNRFGDSKTATTVDASGVALQDVSFGGQAVSRDNQGGAYSAPQWHDANWNGEIAEAGKTAYSNGTLDGTTEWVYPISFQRSAASANSFLTATPGLFYEGTVGDNWLLKGHTAGYDFPPQAPFDGNHHPVEFTAQQALPSAIRDTEVDITWRLSTDGGNNYFTVGESNNRLYVTGGTAADAAGAYETVLDKGCGAADGKEIHDNNLLEDQQSAVDHIWTAFSGNSTRRVNGTVMKYNHDDDTGETAAQMLGDQQGRGRCTCWADLFVLVLRAQGIGATSVRMLPKAGFNALQVNAGSAQGTNGAPYPGTIFNFHQVVRVTCYPARIYDPSYGGDPEEDANSVQLKYEDDHMSKYLLIDWPTHTILGSVDDTKGGVPELRW
ncbi:MAG: hypothetical protein ACHRHE_06060 [Tepidisphaerales bacterium]